MCLMAIGGGAFMNLAYRWGHTVPVRKVFYNLVVTALAVAVAAADSSGHARHIKRDMTTPQIIHRHQGHGQQPGLAAPDGPKPARRLAVRGEASLGVC
jgi:hypothetical protein